MGRIALRALDELLIDRVHEPTLDRDDHGLVRLVADHGALQYAPWHSSTSSNSAARLLRENGLDPGDVAPDDAYPRRIFQLSARPLETQVELFLLQLRQIGLQLIRVLTRKSSAFMAPLLHAQPADELGPD